jgi:hypothetical protein
MINFLQKDYEYLQTFLSTNISDTKLIQLLNKSSALQEVSIIINILRTGDKIEPNTSRTAITFFLLNRSSRLIENKIFYFSFK